MIYFSGEPQILLDALFSYEDTLNTKHICSLKLIAYLNNNYKGNFLVDIPFKNDVYAWLYSLRIIMKDKNTTLSFSKDQFSVIDYILKNKSIC